MKKVLVLLSLAFCLFTSINAQVISRFTWDGPGATPLRADIGPDAISVNSSTVVTVIGSNAGVPNGALNAGSVAHRDINLTLPNSSIFTIPSIDVWVDFRREETGASFYTRGSSFDFGLNGSQLFITFTVENGSGGSTTINSGPIYAIPDDHIFHNYRFLYDNATGRGYVWVDGVTRYTYNGVPGRALVWSNVSPVVGGLMDGTARNVGVLDNFELRLFSPAVLPFSLGNFSTLKKADHVLLNWSVINEVNLSHYIVEQSFDGINFEPVNKIIAKAANGRMNSYELAHFNSKNNTDQIINVSYRIRIVDNDGNISYSEVRVLKIEPVSSPTSISAVPNPAKDFVNLLIQVPVTGQYTCTLYTIDGQLVQSRSRIFEKGKSTFRFALPSNLRRDTPFFLIVENHLTGQKSVLRILRAS